MSNDGKTPGEMPGASDSTAKPAANVDVLPPDPVKEPDQPTGSLGSISKPTSTSAPKDAGMFAYARIASIALFALAFLGMSTGYIPGWISGLAALPVIFAFFGKKKGVIVSAAAVALVLPAWQPIAAVFVAPLFAIVCGVAGWRWKEGKAWRVAGFFGGFVGYCLALALVTQILLPTLHPLAYMAYGHLPHLILPAAMVAGLSYVTWRYALRSLNSALLRWSVRLSVMAGWGIAVVVGLLNLTPTGYELQMRWSMNPEKLAELPHTVNDRILPRATGEYFVKIANNQNGYAIESPHLISGQGKLWWQSPMHNERWYGRILGSVPGVIRVDADKTDKNSQNTTEAGFFFGNRSWVLKSAFRARNFLSEIAEVSYYQRDDKSWVMLVSYVSMRPTWTGAMLPYLAGVMAVEQNGFIRDLSVAEASRQYPGAVFYPPELAARYAQVYGKWRQGFFKTKIAQDGMLTISQAQTNDPGFNPQPYIINFKGLGLQETVVFEPLGTQHYAMVEALMFDAATGSLRTYIVPNSLSLSGPRRCLEQVRSSDTQTDWSNRRTAEPRLTVSAKGIFFLATVTAKETDDPHSQPYITSVVINAKTLHSQRFQTADEIRNYLEDKAEPK